MGNGAAPDWRSVVEEKAEAGDPVAEGLLEVDGRLTRHDSLLETIATKTEANGEQLERVYDQVVVLTASSQHAAQAIVELHHGQGALGDSVQAMALENRGGFEGMKVAFTGLARHVEEVDDDLATTGQYAKVTEARAAMISQHADQLERTNRALMLRVVKVAGAIVSAVILTLLGWLARGAFTP